MKVTVFGLGYVGTVTAAGLAASGHDVVGVDVDPGKVASIAAGTSPVVEPGIEPLLAEAVAAGRLTATTDVAVGLAGSEVSLICVGTPSGSQGETDLSAIARAVADVREAMALAAPPAAGLHSVVIRSTVPPGTGAEVVEPVFASGTPRGWEVGTAMVPEFLREGSGVADFFAPPFVVVGTAHAGTAASLGQLFAFLGLPVQHVDVPTAEALKFSCNAFHAVKVAFANEMGRVFRTKGVDAREVMRLFVMDDKLNIAPYYLRPGFAFGGSCLPKDLRSLLHMARTAGVDLPLLAGTALSNEVSVRDAVDRIVALPHRSVAILGLSFKMDTDDLRESPNVELAERLLGKGYDVRIYDPIINPERLVGSNLRHVEAKLPHLSRLLTASAAAALDGAGAVVVSSSDPAVLAALAEADPAYVLDLTGRLGDEVEALAGYQGIGW